MRISDPTRGAEPRSGSERLLRAVIVTRKSALTQLIERRGTFSQAEFYLRSRGGSIGEYVSNHEKIEESLRQIEGQLAPEQRRARVDRSELERFLFADDDLVVVVGQDGLVANVAKYLKGQAVIGINPDPSTYDGVLTQHHVGDFSQVLSWALERGQSRDGFEIELRVLAEAVREDGQRLLALNEIFAGHQTHQSARYQISAKERSVRHSSSGIICATGTGATGWAKSIASQWKRGEKLPGPTDSVLTWFVREPFPSVATSTELDFGFIQDGEGLRLESEMGENGVIFADGIETDYLEFVSGQRVEIRVAAERLALVVPRDGSERAGREDRGA